jgi:hypothetical protein
MRRKMSWPSSDPKKVLRVIQVVLLAVALISMVVVKHSFGVVPALVVLGAFLLAGWGVAGWFGALDRDRIDAAVDAMDSAPDASEARETALGGLDQDEQAIVRLRRGEVAPGYEDPERVHVRTFGYPRASRVVRTAVFVGCVGMALLPSYALVSGNVRSDQRSWALVVAVGFTALAGLIPVFRWLERAEVRIGAFGIMAVSGFGNSTSIAWSDIGAIDEPRFPSSIVITSRDGRRKIRVYPTLEHFPQFVEMLVAELRRRATGSSAPDVPDAGAN